MQENWKFEDSDIDTPSWDQNQSLRQVGKKLKIPSDFLFINFSAIFRLQFK